MRQNRLLDSFGFLRTDRPHDIQEVIGRLETNAIAAAGGRSVELEPRLATHMLADLTFLLRALTTSLHDEIVDRYRLDNRWSLKRWQFSERNGMKFEKAEWPC